MRSTVRLDAGSFENFESCPSLDARVSHFFREFACDAIEKHGAARGTLLAIRRVLRCHPYHSGGYDPVP